MNRNATAGYPEQGRFFDCRKDPEGAFRRLRSALKREQEDIKHNRKKDTGENRKYWDGRDAELKTILSIVDEFFPNGFKP